MAAVSPAIAVMVPLETWKVWRMSGARTPNATRSKFCTPASPISTTSGSRPAGPKPAPSLLEAAASEGSDLDIRRLRARFGNQARAAHVSTQGIGRIGPGVGDEARHEERVPRR